MASKRKSLSTGLPGLDKVIQSVVAGDNIVWQTDSIEDYAFFVEPFCAHALKKKKKLVYFRFARHPELVGEKSGAQVCRLSATVGFETFTAEIHKVIEEAGRGAFYVFDCLSDLAADWYSDLMLGNFFRVTCPYLYDLDTVTYFALLHGEHSSETVATIRNTTQLLLDVFRHEGGLYVHPLKVDKRYSPTMYVPHVREEGGTFRPVTESSVLSEVLAPVTEQRFGWVPRTLDTWDRKLVQVRKVLKDAGGRAGQAAEAGEVYDRLLRMMVTRDDRVAALASRYLDSSDMLSIRRRMIGTGLIGGKSVGMLLARAILCKTDDRWRQRLETHDSFYVGSDVFYTYLVQNGCWRLRRNQRNPDSFLEGLDEAQQRILAGDFPTSMIQQFVAMLEYFGQSPIIVRSSSLLEDSFGNAFTGKYESVFCPNQGSPEERLRAFLSAVRTVYASTMSREALLYRSHRGLLESDEQMAILVQRVSGAVRGHLFYPQAAGVGLSYNPYAWSEYIEPEAGVLRLVFGLGTRAVNRSDEDYTRVVALNAPLRRPESGSDEVAEYAQKQVDALDLAANRFASLHFSEVAACDTDLPLEMFASRQRAPARSPGDKRARAADRWVLDFKKLLSATPFVEDMRNLLAVLRQAYENQVDIEFTTNFLPDGSYRINLVQCRPLQVKEGGYVVASPDGLAPQDIVLETRGAIVGRSSFTTVDRLIYVDPAAYGQLTIADRFAIARMIGRLTHPEDEIDRAKTIMLLGPGRWGTSTPSLGVPVAFAEINTVSVLCEIVPHDGSAVPDVSLGTHFFNDLVEADMLYMAVAPGKKGDSLNESFLKRQDNRLRDLLPEDTRWSEVVHVIDLAVAPGEMALYVNADCSKQRALCYLAVHQPTKVAPRGQ